jgi:NarL family two-component system response regulator LiaR
MIRVLIVDDHDVVREGLAGFLKAIPDMTLVGEARNGLEAVRLCEQLQPDVALMDMVMPEMDGIAATRILHERFPQMRVVVLTSFGDEAQVQEALRAGATGYLLKTSSAQDIATAIRATMSGQSILSAEAAKALVQPQKQAVTLDYHLKARELDILALLVEGRTNAEIAQRLSLSLSTVKFYISAILTKLNVTSRTEAVALAVEQRLVRKDQSP